MCRFLVTEWRTKACGETVVWSFKKFKSRMGRQKITVGKFFRPGLPRRSETKTGRGWIGLGVDTHGFTVGCFLPRRRRWGRPVLKPARNYSRGITFLSLRHLNSISSVSVATSGLGNPTKRNPSSGL